MINRARVWFGWNRGDNELNRALTGKGSGADHQLRPVGSPGIGDKTGIRRSGVLQNRVTAIGSGGEGPVKA